MKRLLFIVLGISFLAANAAELNAPITNKPTLGSEIYRGSAAGNDCYFVGDNNFSPTKYAECISKAESTNIQSQPTYKPFSLGLHFRAWLWEDIEITMADEPPPSRFKRRLAAEASSYAPLDFEIFRKIQSELGITDKQLFGIIQLTSEGQLDTSKRFAYWSNKTAKR